ncbi:hypothetical protein EIP91_003894 [Steccherinum ochraceum]|uniref:DUF4470 domain-containing protein n=1 Tax=Steccherinum ochraceum TaxID=92696 RepID=A0A4V2MW21_9APHY|nr:hypothetical protein EIP91_003894 [Steccherinum ochraceum]
MDRMRCYALQAGQSDPTIYFFPIGHDDPASLLHLGDADGDPFDFGALSTSQLSQLAFLFGGIGDARHLFSSIIGLHAAYKKLDEPEKAAFKVHITALDLQPSVLARDLCLLLLLDQLARAEKGTELRAELLATVLYVYLGVVIPPYCHTRFTEVVNVALVILERQPWRLPPWLHATDRSIAGMLETLTYWSNELEGKVPQGMLDHHRPQLDGEDGDHSLPGVADEERWYRGTKVFMPPASLRGRHDGFDEAWEAIRSSGQDEDIQRLLDEANAHILSTWKPNISFFDPQTKATQDYPFLDINLFNVIKSFHRFVITVPSAAADDEPTSFQVAEQFFGVAADGLAELRSCIKIEFLQGDLFYDLTTMRLDPGSDRPAEFPRSFDRMWLSDIPDFTHGQLTEAIYCIPGLQLEKGSVAGFNCILNKGIWADANQFFYTYTLLYPEEVSQYLGCRVLQASPSQPIILKRLELPLPLESLASQTDLSTWLTRVLFSILVPGTIPPHIYYPGNIVLFTTLLIHLAEVGFSTEWLSSFLNIILANTMETDLAPYLGQLPIPTSERDRRVERRTVNLAPWHVDFERVLAVVWDVLPFDVALPPAFPRSSKELVSLAVHASLDNFTPSTRDSLPKQLPVMALLFFRPASGTSADQFAKSVDEVLEGRLEADGAVHIATVVDVFDMASETIQWTMSRARVEGMKAEGGWVMAPYRFDVRESVVVSPFSLDEWKEST